jgi:cytochrome c-type biogenesis protein CcmH/NrfF
MITLGIVLLVLGLLTHIAILWSIGVLLVVIGAILWLLGAAGRQVGGRRHYY